MIRILRAFLHIANFRFTDAESEVLRRRLEPPIRQPREPPTVVAI